MVPFGPERASDFIPDDALRAAPVFGLILRTIAGQTLAVLSCVFALLATIHLSSVTGLAVVGALIVLSAVGAVRRIPFCGWCVLGLVIGLTLGRFS